VFRTEDVTLDTSDMPVADPNLLSPTREFLSEELLSSTALWGTSPMSPLKFFSPGRSSAFLATPTKDSGNLLTQFSPLRQSGWNVFMSPARPYLQSPLIRHTDFAQMSPERFMSSQWQGDSKSLLTGADWQISSPLKMSPTQPSPARALEFGRPMKSYKRKIQLSDFIAATAESTGNSLQKQENNRRNNQPACKSEGPNILSAKRPAEKRMKHSDPQPDKPADDENSKIQPGSLMVLPVHQELETPAELQEAAPRRKCNCKKSECLKLYCECFAAQTGCGPECKCQGCRNTSEHKLDVEEAVKQVLDRNPYAFDPKIQSRETASVSVDGSVITVESHNRGCNCRKSGCQKKYCECYHAGVLCGAKCKCQGCQNCGDADQTSSERPNKIESFGSAPGRSRLARRLDFDNLPNDGKETSSGSDIDYVGVKRRISFLRSPSRAMIASPCRPPVPVFRGNS